MQTHHPIQHGDPRVIVMDRGDYTTCTVILRGASITSWRIQNEEQLFLSRSSKLDDYDKYRGTFSLVFPHFDRWRFGRQHGFARDLMWHLQRGPERLDNGNIYLELFLPSNPFTRSCWNHDFELRYSITLHPSELETRMVIVNTDSVSFSCNLELHWYIGVKNIDKLEVSGLKDRWFSDRVVDTTMGDPKLYVKQSEDHYTPFAGCHRLYRDAPTEFVIMSHAGDNKIFKIRTHNLPDLNFWNPGAVLDDLEEDEIHNFLCVDCGYIAKQIKLAPHTFWTASQTIEVSNTNKVKPQSINWLKYTEGYC